jgi:hypothetical protein
VTEDYKDRCSLLYYDIVKENAFLTTKVHITLKIVTAKFFKSETVPAEQKHMNWHRSAKRAFAVDACIIIRKKRGEKTVEPEVANKKEVRLSFS